MGRERGESKKLEETERKGKGERRVLDGQKRERERAGKRRIKIKRDRQIYRKTE